MCDVIIPLDDSFPVQIQKTEQKDSKKAIGIMEINRAVIITSDKELEGEKLILEIIQGVIQECRCGNLGYKPRHMENVIGQAPTTQDPGHQPKHAENER